MTKIRTLILCAVVLTATSCKQRPRNVELPKNDESVLSRIQSGLSNMPKLPRKIYVVLDSMKNGNIDNKKIQPFHTVDISTVSPNKYKSIDNLLDMEIGVGISELLHIDKKNYSFLPTNKKYFIIGNGIGLFEKYVSRKTNSVINGFVIYRSEKDYYSFHIADTLDFDMNIKGAYEGSVKLDLYYEITKDSISTSRHGMNFRNGTIIRFDIVD